MEAVSIIPKKYPLFILSHSYNTLQALFVIFSIYSKKSAMSALKALMTDESLHLCRLTFRSDILSLAECKYQHEDRVEEQQAESETYALAEGLGKSEYQHDGVNDVDKRDK